MGRQRVGQPVHRTELVGGELVHEVGRWRVGQPVRLIEFVGGELVHGVGRLVRLAESLHQLLDWQVGQ